MAMVGYVTYVSLAEKKVTITPIRRIYKPVFKTHMTINYTLVQVRYLPSQCNEGSIRLSYYDHYSKPACEFERLLNYTVDKCQCVTYLVPHAQTVRNEMNCEYSSHVNT